MLGTISAFAYRHKNECNYTSSLHGLNSNTLHVLWFKYQTNTDPFWFFFIIHASPGTHLKETNERVPSKLLIYHQILSLLVEHRAFMKTFQPLQSPAVPLTSFLGLLELFIPSSFVLRHVLFGLPLLLYP